MTTLGEPTLGARNRRVTCSRAEIEFLLTEPCRQRRQRSATTLTASQPAPALRRRVLAQRGERSSYAAL